MHAIIAEDDNLVIFTDYDGRIIDCYEFQRLSFTDSLKTILRKAEKDEALRFVMEKV
jgi:hypothetical protein